MALNTTPIISMMNNGHQRPAPPPKYATSTTRGASSFTNSYNIQNHWEPMNSANNGHHYHHIPAIIHCSSASATATTAILAPQTSAKTATAATFSTTGPTNYAASSLSSLAPSSAEEVFDNYSAIGQWPSLAAADFSTTALATADDIGAIVDYSAVAACGGIHQLPALPAMMIGGAIGTTSGTTPAATTMGMEAARIQPAASWWRDPQQQQQPQSVAQFGMTAAQPSLFATDWTAPAAMATNGGSADFSSSVYPHCGDTTAMTNQLTMMHPQQQQQVADDEEMMVYNNSSNNHPSHSGAIPTIMHHGQQQQQQFSADQFLPQLHQAMNPYWMGIEIDKGMSGGMMEMPAVEMPAHQLAPMMHQHQQQQQQQAADDEAMMVCADGGIVAGMREGGNLHKMGLRPSKDFCHKTN